MWSPIAAILSSAAPPSGRGGLSGRSAHTPSPTHADPRLPERRSAGRDRVELSEHAPRPLPAPTLELAVDVVEVIWVGELGFGFLCMDWVFVAVTVGDCTVELFVSGSRA